MKKTILSFSFLIIFLKHWNELADLGLKYYESFPDTLRLNDKVFSWEKAANTSMPMLRNENYLLWRLIDENKDPKGWPENFLEPKGDKTGPEIKIISEALVDQDQTKLLTVKVEAKDPAGIKTVYLKHKPFPSTYDWETVPMQKKDGVWISSLEISPVGALWSIGALDADNNGSMWPDFRNDIPYRMVAPWESTF